MQQCCCPVPFFQRGNGDAVISADEACWDSRLLLRLDLLELPDGRGRNDRKKQAWLRIDGSRAAERNCQPGRQGGP